MVIDPAALEIQVTDDQITLTLSGEPVKVDRVVRAFPRTHPNGFISFLDALGHEIGLLETMEGMAAESRTALEEFLKRQYFVPTIEEILSIEMTGTASDWVVLTDDGDRAFTLAGREALDGEKPPEIRIIDIQAQRYRIADFWALDRESRQAAMELLPDKILKSKLVARNSKGMTMKMR